jgi:hypothetical protein
MVCISPSLFDSDSIPWREDCTVARSDSLCVSRDYVLARSLRADWKVDLFPSNTRRSRRSSASCSLCVLVRPDSARSRASRSRRTSMTRSLMCHASTSWRETVGEDVLAALFTQSRHLLQLRLYRREFLQRGGNGINKGRAL